MTDGLLNGTGMEIWKYNLEKILKTGQTEQLGMLTQIQTTAGEKVQVIKPPFLRLALSGSIFF